MTALTLRQSRILAGRWRGHIEAPGGVAPRVEVLHGARALDDVTLTEEGSGTWVAEAAIPPDVLADGVLTFVVRDASSGESIGSFAIVAGSAAEDDLRAEVSLLRAELDLLKRAFRRHCAETSPGDG